MIQAFESYKDARKSSALAAAQSGDDTLTEVAVAQAKSESMSSLIEQFAAALSQGSDDETTSFSYQQIKETFINELLIPSKEKGTTQMSLFAENMTEEEDELTLFKHMDTILGKAAETPSSSTSDQDRKGLAKSFKKDFSKAEELLQSAPTTKSDIDTAAAALKARSTARTLPTYVTQQVGRGIVRAINQGETSLKLQLKPAELGRLTMTIDNHGSSLKVTIVTENQAARDLLASNVNELKAALNTAGISLESFEVDMSSDFGQSMADADNQAGQFSRRNGGRSGSKFNMSEEGSLDEISLIETGLSNDGSYHFVA